MAVTVIEKYSNTTTDLLYSLLIALGGTDMDIEEKYFSTQNDLIYAILKVLDAGGGGGGGGSNYKLIEVVSADFANKTDYLNAALTGKTLQIFSNNIPRYLESSEYQVISGGIRFLMPEFDKDVNDYRFFISVTGADIPEEPEEPEDPPEDPPS